MNAGRPRRCVERVAELKEGGEITGRAPNKNPIPPKETNRRKQIDSVGRREFYDSYLYEALPTHACRYVCGYVSHGF